MSFFRMCVIFKYHDNRLLTKLQYYDQAFISVCTEAKEHGPPIAVHRCWYHDHVLAKLLLPLGRELRKH